MSVIVKGGGGKPEEEKTVTAGTSAIEVLPSSGKTMKKVTVNPTPSQSKTVSPSTSQQTVSPDSGKLLSQVIVKAMEDVTPEVTAQTPIIAEIAEKFGVSITTPSGTNKQILQWNNTNLQTVNTSFAGTQTKDVIAGTGDTTVYPDSGKLLSGVTVHPTPSQSKTITPGKSSKTVIPDSGKLLSSVVISGDSDLVAGNIKKGIDIFGVIGSLAEGVDLKTMLGCKMAVDKFKHTSRTGISTGSEYIMNHSLGEQPKLFFLLSDLSTSRSSLDIGCFVCVGRYQTSGFLLYYNSNRWDPNTNSGTLYVPSGDSTTIKLTCGDYTTRYFTAGVEYTLITFA